MNWLLWIGLVVVIVRGTRLIVKDEFPPVRYLRDWVINTFGAFDVDDKLVGGRRWGKLGYSLAYVFTCQWCMSFWVGLLVWGIAAALGWSVPLPVVLIAFAMMATGIWTTIEDLADQRYRIGQLEIERREGRRP
jgi:hypothetical protein